MFNVLMVTSAATRLSVTIALGVAFAGCNGRENVQCQQNTNCDLSSAGLCVAATTGNNWCAYPDPGCSSGYRYSHDDVGDSVSGVCTGGFTLRISVGGSGSGTVSATPTDLVCAAGTCTGSFPSGTQVQLTAKVTGGSFLGWSESCRGSGTCNITMDRDQSVGALFGMRGEALWARQLGSVGDDFGSAIATDSDNNIIAVGEFSHTPISTGTTLMSAGGLDIYVLKLDPASGNIVWAKQFGGAGDDRAMAVAVDASNNIYIAGSFEGSVDFGGGIVQAAGSADAFLLKLTASGDLAWVRAIGGATSDSISDQGIALTVRANTVAIAGIYNGSMIVDGIRLTALGSTDAFVQGLTTDGVGKWIRSIGGIYPDAITGIALDSSENVVITGFSVSPTIDFGDGVLCSGGAFIAKLAAQTGAPLFSKRLGSTTGNSSISVMDPTGISVDSSDNIFLSGWFGGTVDLGDGVPLTADREAVFVARYTLAGAYRWGRSFVGNGSGRGQSMVINNAGDLVIAGYFSGTISFGGQPLSAASGGVGDTFAARFAASDGSYLNAMSVGGTGSDICSSVSFASDGRFYLTGYFDGFADLGGQSRTPVGLTDSYIIGFAPL